MSEFKKKKIAVVAGEIFDPMFAETFQQLSSFYEVHLFCFDSKLTKKMSHTSFKKIIFETLKEMPGYMRGLESMLAGFDLIISFEVSNFSSFQVTKFCEKSGTPNLVVVNEYEPLLYLKANNIKAIQNDILGKATWFLVTHNKSKFFLRNLGVEEGKIKLVAPLLEIFSNTQKNELGEKFRNYFKFPKDLFLITVFGSFCSENKHENIIQTLDFIEKQTAGLTKNTKVLFCGDGPKSKELKDVCVEFGGSAKFLFLEQDVKDFLIDLLAASDLVVEGFRLKEEMPRLFPFIKNYAKGLGVKVLDANLFLDQMSAIEELSHLLHEGFEQTEAIGEPSQTSLEELRILIEDLTQNTREVEATTASDFDKQESIFDRCLKEERFDEAVIILKKLLASHPNNYEYLLKMGMLHRKLAMPDESIFWFKKAVLVDPVRSKGRQLLIQSAFEAFSLENAAEEVSGLVESIEDEALYRCLSLLYSKIGNTGLSEKYHALADAIKLAPSV